jgi:hypothetical protein
MLEDEDNNNIAIVLDMNSPSTIVPTTPNEIIDITHDNPKEKKRRLIVNPIWEDFTVKPIDSKTSYVYCKSCLWKNKFSGSTTCMLHHKAVCVDIKAKNAINIEGEDTLSPLEEGQTLLFRSANGSLQSRNTGFSEEKMRVAIDEMIIIDELPFFTVEKDGFKGMMQVARPEYTMKSSRLSSVI